MEFEHPLKISSHHLIIYKEIDGSGMRKRGDLSTTAASMLNESVASSSASSSHMFAYNESSQVVSIYSSPSKCKHIAYIRAHIHVQFSTTYVCNQFVSDEIFSGNLQIAAIKPDLDKPSPKIGVSCIEFSHDNRFMYTRNDSMPNILWIWDMNKFKLTNVLIQIMAIKCKCTQPNMLETKKAKKALYYSVKLLLLLLQTGVCWDPAQTRLALCTNNNKIYMWSPKGCISVEVPVEATFLVQSIRWNKDGTCLILIGKDQYCVTYLLQSKKPDEQQQQADDEDERDEDKKRLEGENRLSKSFENSDESQSDDKSWTIQRVSLFLTHSF